jgi:predicted RecA/RadA family phage recombinase
MSRTFIAAGRRRAFTPSVAHKAGELCYDLGYFGVVQDDVAASALGTLVLDAGVQELKNVFGSNLNPGVSIYAAPSVIATSLLLYPLGSTPSGAVAVGRVWATSPASSATATLKVLLYHPNTHTAK